MVVGGEDGIAVRGQVVSHGDWKDVGSKAEKELAKRANLLTFMSGAQLVSYLSNPKFDLSNVSAIVIDEAHERTIYCDILLGLLRTANERWGHVKVVVTSATLDTEAFCSFMSLQGNPKMVPLLIPGRLYPVTVEYKSSASQNETLSWKDVGRFGNSAKFSFKEKKNV